MKISISDLILVPPKGSRNQAIQNSLELAIYAEKLGYHRLWYGEHHADPMIMSSSPEILIPLIAGMTSKIKVGSGGILLNHYSPFKIAEMFSLLSEIYPNRIDLGVGRSTSGKNIDLALRRDRSSKVKDDYNLQIEELISWLTNNDLGGDFSHIHLPNIIRPSLWLLGSSTKSALQAGLLGIPYVFADFFHPEETKSALKCYFENFNALGSISSSPYAILSFRIITANSENAVRRLLAPIQLMKEQLENRTFKSLCLPEDAIDILGGLPPMKYEFSFGKNSPMIALGTPHQLHQMIKGKIGNLPIEEIMFQDFIVDQKARLQAYKLLSKAFIS